MLVRVCNANYVLEIRKKLSLDAPMGLCLVVFQVSEWCLGFPGLRDEITL